MKPSPNRALAAWLLSCCALVLLVLVSGGVTRLTRSGLSIVEWKPVRGVLPPMGEAQWRAEFSKYRLSPEYREVNEGMTLSEFKSIFWMEWAHRLLARLAGLVFLLPFALFAGRGKISWRLLPRLLAISALWALQGAAGWFMVKSGLVDVPHVSAYRLAVHLALAFSLYGLMFATALELMWPGQRRELPPRWTWTAAALLAAPILSGALVAGLRAGVYRGFPLTEHWALAAVLGAAALWLWPWSASRALSWPARRAIGILIATLAIQIGLGVMVLVRRVPIPLAVAHQANALLVLSAALLLRHDLRSEPAPTCT